MRNFSVSQLNPYREIPETIFKKRAVTLGIFRKLFPDFAILGMTQGIFRKLFPGKFYEYLPMKKYFFPKMGNDPGEFPETFFQILEKVSGKASESLPVLGKKIFFHG